MTTTPALRTETTTMDIGAAFMVTAAGTLSGIGPLLGALTPLAAFAVISAVALSVATRIALNGTNPIHFTGTRS